MAGQAQGVAAETPACTSPLQCVHRGVTGAVDRVVSGCGRHASRRPWVVIAATVVACGVAMCGMLVNWTYETDAELMW